MKFYKALTLFFLVLTASVFSQTNDSLPGPIIEFESKIIDFDSVPESSDPFRFITVKNTGTDTLLIFSVKSSCGCLVGSMRNRIIAPNDSAILKAKYDTKRIGRIRKTITVKSNAVNTPSIYLKVIGFIYKRDPIDIEDGPVRD